MKKYKIVRAIAILSLLVVGVFWVSAQGGENHAPVIKNIQVQQRQGTRIVDIFYDVEDADGDVLTISVHVSFDGGNTFETDLVHTCIENSDIGENIAPGTPILFVNNDFTNVETSSKKNRVQILAADICTSKSCQNMLKLFKRLK